MAWQQTAQQLLGPQAGPVIQRLSQINPNYDWSGVISQYVPALNAAYGEDWKDPSRGSSEGIVSALLQNAQADGQGWAASQIEGQRQRQLQQEQQILAAQNPADDNDFGALAGLGLTAAGLYFGMPSLSSMFSGLGGAAEGLGALNSFDTGAMSSILSGGGGGGLSAGNALSAFSAANSGLSNLGFTGDAVSGPGISMPSNMATGIGSEGTSLIQDNFGDPWGVNKRMSGDYFDFIPPEGDPLGNANMDPNYSSGFGSTRPGDIVYDVNGDVIPQGGPNDVYKPGFLDGLGSMMAQPGFQEAVAKYGISAALQRAQGGGLGGWAQTLMGGAFGQGKGDYQFPWGNVIGSVIGAYGAKQNANQLADAVKYAADKADPFASQRPQYQAQLPGAMQDFQNTINEQNQGYDNLAGGLRAQFDTMQKGYQSGFDNLFADQQAMNRNMGSADWWNKNSLLAGLNDMAVNDTSRKLASQGYNMSGNVPMEVAQRLQQNNANFVPKFMESITQNQNAALTGFNQNAGMNLTAFGNNAGQQLAGYNQNASNILQGKAKNTDMVGTAAGYNFDPGYAGQLAMTGAQAGINMNNQMYGNLGAGLQSIFNGSQPSMTDQIFGTPRNQSLGDVFKGWSL